MKPGRILTFLILIAVLLSAGYYYVSKNKVETEPNDVSQIVVITEKGIYAQAYPEIDAEWLAKGYWIPQSLLENYSIFADYDEEDGLVILSDGYHTIRYDLIYGDAWLDNQTFTMKEPVYDMGQIWVSASDIASVFNLEYDMKAARKTLFLKDNAVSYSLASLSDKALLFMETDEVRVLEKLKKDATVVVFEAEPGYKHVMTADYQVGYIKSDLLGEATYIDRSEEAKVPLTRETPVFLTWEIYGRGYDTAKIGPLTGVNVISPTWYALSDSKGNFDNKSSEAYIDWAKSRDYELWALVSNDFDVDRTSAFLHSAQARTDFIDNLLDEYLVKDYEGVNIDFENVYKEDKRVLTQFVAELTAAFRAKGIVVSMDVTVPGGSDTWSKCYDREALGQIVDYLAIMTYDEHWASSPISGSVASYNWVRENMIKISEMVPSEKLLLGIPYYMRVWTEVPSQTFANQMDVKSGVLNMPNAEKFIKEKNLNLIWDENARQHYAGYFEDGALKKIWFENATSIKEKAALVNELNLGGAAVWRRGFETEDIWGIISEALYKE